MFVAVVSLVNLIGSEKDFLIYYMKPICKIKWLLRILKWEEVWNKDYLGLFARVRSLQYWADEVYDLRYQFRAEVVLSLFACKTCVEFTGWFA